MVRGRRRGTGIFLQTRKRFFAWKTANFRGLGVPAKLQGLSHERQRHEQTDTAPGRLAEQLFPPPV